MEVKDLKMSGKDVYLHFRKHRVKCNCNERAYVERLDFIDTNEVVTKRLEDEIYNLCKIMSIKAVSIIYGLNWDTVKRIDKKNITTRIAGEWNFENLTKISIDEYAYSKRKCITVISNLNSRKVIYIEEGRKKEDLDRFFEVVLGKERCSRITTVTMDLCSPYKKSVKEHLKNATTVYDKFHLMRLLHEQVDEVRKQEQERLEEEGQKLLKNKRWLLLKGQEKLKEDQRQRLGELLSQNENLTKCYLLKEDFREFYRTYYGETEDPHYRFNGMINTKSNWYK